MRLQRGRAASAYRCFLGFPAAATLTCDATAMGRIRRDPFEESLDLWLELGGEEEEEEEERGRVTPCLHCRVQRPNPCSGAMPSQHSALGLSCCVNLVRVFFFRVRKLMDISVLLASITPLWVSCYRSQEETGIGSDTGEHEIECTTTALDEARARRVHRGWSPAVLLLVTLAWYLAAATYFYRC